MNNAFRQRSRAAVVFVVLAILGVLLVLGIIFVAWAVGINNRLVRLNQSVDSAWAQVENVYQRRLDLIPNLVNTVKGAAAHELQVQVGVVQARAQATQIKIDPSNPEALKNFASAQTQLGGALSRLIAVAENYPQIRANENFLSLQQQLEGTENRISVERGRFNDAVREYNTAVQVFPGMLIAAFRNFKQRPYFTGEPGAERPPTVDFGTGGTATPSVVSPAPASTGPGVAFTTASASSLTTTQPATR